MEKDYRYFRRKIKLGLMKKCLVISNSAMEEKINQLNDKEIECLYMKHAWETNRDIYGDTDRVRALWLQWQNHRLVAGHSTKVKNLDEYPETRTHKPR